MDNAKLQLAYSSISAPISGRLGLRLVDEGNMVHASDANGLVVITQLQPITVVFSIPEDRISEVMKRLRAGERLSVDAYDRDQRNKLATGSLLTVDNQIDPTTGTVRLKAQFANEDSALFPNQFVNAKLLLRVEKDATLIPTTAVQRGAQGPFVYVVKPDQTVGVRPVTVGATQGDDAAIATGVAPGELVVVDGADKLRDGSKVELQTAAGPDGRDWPAGSAGTEAVNHAPSGTGAARDSQRLEAVNLSRPFILRPVATALLMAALLLTGAVAYRLLPVSALPQVDYPTIQVVTFYPGASPDVMASSVTAPLERQFGQMPGLNQMTSASSGGSSVITLQFSLDLNLDVAEQEVQAAINASFSYLPRDLPNPPVYSKVNPADAPVLALALTSKTLPLPQVEDLADTRLAQKISQLPGVGLVSISGGQRPAVRVQANPKALASYGIGLEDLRSCDRGSQRQPGQGHLRRAAPRLHHRGQRPAAVQQRVSAADRRLPQRLARAPVRRGRRARRCREREAGRVDERCARGDPQHPAPARRERDRGRGPGEEAAAAAAKRVAGLGAGVDADRPHHHHPRVGARSAVLAAALGRPGGDGDLPVPAQPCRDRHPERIGAAVPGGDVRGDVSRRVQPRQSVAHGAHHRDRLRGRRCHRDDREHRALRGGRRAAAAGGAQGRQADRVHHPVADRLAHRGADPAAVHGRRRGAPVPRVRHHA